MMIKPVIPKEHGVWVALFAPMLIGAFGYRADHLNLAGLALLAMSAAMGALLMEPLRLLLKQAHGLDNPRMIRWSAIYSIASLTPFTILVTVYSKWALIWLIIPAGLMVSLRLWSGSVQKHRTTPVEMVGILGLCMSAPVSYYIQHENFSPDGLALYALCAIWFVDRTITARTALDRMRSSAVSSSSGEKQGETGIEIKTHLAAFCLTAAVAFVFHDSVSWFVVAPYTLVFYKHLKRMFGQPDPTDPMKLGFAEMRLCLVFSLTMIAALRLASIIH